jgi:RNA polymerase primary sigma factor
MTNIIRTNTETIVNNTNALTALKNDIRRKCTPFSAEEEVIAFEQYAVAEGNEKDRIRTMIVNANLRFALSIAQKYTADGDMVAELVSLATIGLYNAVDTFDIARGYKFITHAIHSIRAEFSEYFRNDANLVRRSNNALIGTKDKKVAEKIRQREMREPSEEELIDALKAEYGIEVKYNGDIVALRTKSIDDFSSAEEEDTYGDSAEFNSATAVRNEYESEVENEHNAHIVGELLKMLSVKERDIITKYFGIGCEEMTIENIAEELDCTAERVRQIIAHCLTKMKGKATRLVAE